MAHAEQYTLELEQKVARLQKRNKKKTVQLDAKADTNAKLKSQMKTKDATNAKLKAKVKAKDAAYAVLLTNSGDESMLSNLLYLAY